MGERTGIQWTDATWNPTRGCSRVSEGCRHCYAETIAVRFSDVGKPFHGFADIGPQKGHGGWTGRVELIPEKLDEPLRWRKPRRVFVNSMSDLFHEKLPDGAIDRVFAVMALAPQHTFQVLTKRAERMRVYFDWRRGQYDRRAQVAQAANVRRGYDADRPADFAWSLPNVWLGVSVEDQATADARIPLLLQTPAAVRFVSYEPALERVNFGGCEDLDWIIVGGESGPGARAFDVAWARETVDWCRAAGVACFVKQLGSEPFSEPDGIASGSRSFWTNPPIKYRRGEQGLDYRRLKDHKGGDAAEWPEDLRVREFPQVRSTP